MWITILVLVGALLIYVCSVYSDEKGSHYHRWGEIIFTGFGAVILTSLLWVLVMMASAPKEKGKTYVITEAKEYNIVSASQTDKLEGRHYLFSGYIDEKPVYKAYKVNEDGSLQMVSLDANTSKIIETDDVPPHIRQCVKGELIDVKWGWWRRGVFGSKDGWFYKRLITIYPENTGIIYIPTGTIKPCFDGMNL